VADRTKAQQVRHLVNLLRDAGHDERL